MPMPVKISDSLLGLAKTEAQNAHRSATAQIEHWATLGRAVEAMLAYGEILALKRVGRTIPIPRDVPRDEVQGRLAGLVEKPHRGKALAHIRAAGGPLYEADPVHPGRVVEVGPNGRRTPGRIRGRRFVPAWRRSSKRAA